MKLITFVALLGGIEALNQSQNQEQKFKTAQTTHMHDPVARSSQEAAAMKSIEETVAETYTEGYALHDDDHDEDHEQEKAKKAAEQAKDNMSTPVVEFDNAYGHENFDNPDALKQDIADVKIEMTEAGQGPYCKLHDWTTVHWKGYRNGALVEDSEQHDQKLPKVFRLGHYEVSKCWDIAIMQMKAGGKATVHCPGALDKGGNVDQYTHFNSEWNHQGSDMVYEFSVSECGINPPSLQPDHFHEPLIPHQCFYLVSAGKYGKGSDLAIEVATEDAYAPRVTGIYNIDLTHFHGREADNKAQQFYFHDEDNTIHSYIHPDAAIFEGYNKNLIVYKNIHVPNQRFEYHAVRRLWTNMSTGRALDIADDKFEAHQNVHTNDVDGSPAQKWDIVYCDEDHGHEHYE